MLTTIELSLPGHPKNAYKIIPTTEKNPQATFQAAIYLARGLYLDIANPDSNIPIAENANATVPVTKL